MDAGAARHVPAHRPREQHGAAAGPMLPVTRDLATVPAEDVEAIAAYILSIQKPANGRDAPRPRIGRTRRDDPRRAAARCCSRHRARSATGRADAVDRRAANAFVQHGRERRYAAQCDPDDVQRHRLARRDTLNYMPSFVDQYDDAQIADLAAYVRATYTDRPAWSGVDALAAKLRKEDTPDDYPHRQRRAAHAGHRSVHAAAVCAAQRPAPARREVRLRPRAMRRMHGDRRRQADVLVPDAGGRGRHAQRAHHREPRHRRASGPCSARSSSIRPRSAATASRG